MLSISFSMYELSISFSLKPYSRKLSGNKDNVGWRLDCAAFESRGVKTNIIMCWLINWVEDDSAMQI